MDVSESEPAEESQPSSHNVVFKTPLPCSTLSAPMLEESGNASAFSPDLTSSSSQSSQKIGRGLERDFILQTPNDYSYTSMGSEPSSLKVNFLQILEVSPDSGVDCESFCLSDPASIDLNEDVSQDMSDAVDFHSPPKIPRLGPDCLTSTVSCSQRVWQSTPANPNFEVAPLISSTPLECSDSEKSPSKRRRPSSRKASKDLFQSRRLGPTTFERPFLGNYPNIQSLAQTPSVGQEKVDFLSYLGKHALLQPALDAITGYLDPKDLCRACLVSRSWNNIIGSVPKAMRRKREYVELRNQTKENLHQFLKKTELGDELPHRGQLLAIQNLSKRAEVPRPSPRSPPVSPSKVRFNLFLKEGQKLENGQTLVQCPQCKLPSRRETDHAARCTRRGCQYYFCILCLCKFHSNKPCPVSVKHRKRQVAIGSRESRRNLQRLCN